jgi:hypothetical protein
MYQRRRRQERDVGAVRRRRRLNQGQAEVREAKLRRQEETWRKIRPEMGGLGASGQRGEKGAAGPRADLFHSFSEPAEESGL